LQVFRLQGLFVFPDSVVLASDSDLIGVFDEATV